ncbi:hypothetical protein NUU61_008701 [Penicillium alfredii]|uniref:BRCT domain-containing protein n=1 Tax=Penicillium alfredii TaxID=1506179 RepID=A0A9W9JWZ0_9EURO|nr:uncharacterized protein NUU61_008701 [Penicillium alfredii]KAJ5084122.1 hypothetical protein NUU61_008701 [Penicillium alfredii]
MVSNPLFGSSSPQELTANSIHHTSIFSSTPPTFILPTHLTLERLHEVENRLIEYGGNLTYDISEAGLILGNVSQKKRAALELRSHGVWTEEIPELSSSQSKAPSKKEEPPVKRRRIDGSHLPKDAATEIVDLSTESEEEEDGGETRHSPAQDLIQAPEGQLQIVVVVKLEWLERCIKVEECLPQDAFVIYRGQKVAAPSSIGAGQKSPEKIPTRILQRAKEDATLNPPPAPSSNRFLARRSKEVPDGAASQRNPPVLYRQTTSEHDETVSLPPPPDWVRNQVLYACMRSAPLHPPNEDFISQLEKIRRIRELTLDDVGVRAYSTSIAALAAYPYLIRRPSEIIALPGCDVKIANLFAEFQQSGGCNHTDDDGNVAAADMLEMDPVLRVLNTFYRIWGVGSKTAREFYYQRGWRDLDDVVEQGWNSLSRVQQIGVKFYDEFLDGVPRKESENIAGIVRRHADRVRPDADGDIDCVLVGGYRRGKKISGDVDLILTHRDDTVTRNLVVDVVASLETEHYVTHTLALNLSSSHRDQQTLPFCGDDTGKHFDSLDKALVVWQDPHFGSSDNDTQPPKKNPNPHRRVDIIISPWRTVGCAVLGWSGDTTFQRDLRRYAKKAHAWKFDSSGVREHTAGGQVVDLEHGGESWEERERLVMERLGVGWRPPDERCTR